MLTLLTTICLLQSAPAGELVRSYDLRGLELRGENAAPHALRFLPALTSRRQGGDGEGEALGKGPQPWIDLLADLLGPASQVEGQALTFTGDGRLIVAGPQALHENVQALIGALQAQATAEVRLLVDVVSLTAEELKTAPLGVIPIARANELAQRAQERFDLPLSMSQGAALDQRVERELLVDYDVEVAGSVAIHDPTVVICGLGTELRALAAPASDGVHLALTAKRGTFRSERRDPGARIVARHVGDDGRSITTPCATLLEDPTSEAAAFGTALHLGSDQALAFVCGLDGGRAELILVRVRGTASPVHGLLLGDGDGLVFTHLGAWAPPELTAYGRLFTRERRFFSFELNDSEYPSLLTCAPKEIDASAYADVFARGLGRGVARWEVGPWFVQRVTPRQDLVPRALARRVLSLDVQCSVDGRVLARAGSAVRVGSNAALNVAREAFDLTDCDVEIAEGSAIADPRLTHVFEGLALCLRVSERADGGLDVQTTGMAQAIGARRTKVALDEFTPALEERDVRHLSLDGRQSATRGEDGSHRLTFGELGATGLRVDVTLR